MCFQMPEKGFVLEDCLRFKCADENVHPHLKLHYFKGVVSNIVSW